MNQRFLKQWNELQKVAQNKTLKDLQALFNEDENRFDDLSFELGDIFVDFSKNWINNQVVADLIELCHCANLEERIRDLFAGRNVNVSENKAATHTIQRKAFSDNAIMADRQKMFDIASNYQSGVWLTAFGEKVKTVVNIGIGGSYLGPKLTVEALSDLQTNNEIKVLFYPSVDSVALKYIIQTADIRSTLFCVGSKSLGTIETARNTETILQLLKRTNGYQPSETNQSFVASTTNLSKAQELNIPESHIMPFDPATGGRFSVWSSIGFPVLMAIGEKKFMDFLAGAEKVDQHFENTTPGKNIPVIMAMVSIWYRNFLDLSAYAVIPYDVRLKNLPAWSQQLMMESNGKRVDNSGKSIQNSTSPWLFGDHGQLSQHAFFQAFHQGKDILPIDFIGVLETDNSDQDFLLINMLSQSAALMSGNTDSDPHSYCPGNRPSTTFLIKKLSPFSLGQLLALYEHMIFVQSVIWNINCFDQPGVELGKKMAKEIVEHMQNDNIEQMKLDKSTQKLLNKVLNHGK
ncbi:MAG: glucose-6-phosphate isomerase [Marinicellaceae bacterium]